MTEDSQTFKHVVKLSYHYIRYEVARRNVILKFLKGTEQIGDTFTKALGKMKFLKF